MEKFIRKLKLSTDFRKTVIDMPYADLVDLNGTSKIKVKIYHSFSYYAYSTNDEASSKDNFNDYYDQLFSPS